MRPNPNPDPAEMAAVAADKLVATVPSAMRPSHDGMVREMTPMVAALERQFARQDAYRARWSSRVLDRIVAGEAA